MLQSNDTERKVEELTINVPWGHIACKWWGSKSIRPIVCVHGWQDNAGSFDPLILQLPDHLSFLAVDLPGHGLSSRIADGMLYSVEHYVYSLMLISDHFGWEKVSLMGHSFGSILCFLFAATFPKKCDMVIALDALRPFPNHFRLIHRYFAKGLDSALKADIRNQEDIEPPVYTFSQLLEKLKHGTLMAINETSAPYVLGRAVQASKTQPDKYFFTRDSRMKSSPIPMMAHEITAMFASNIISAYCFIKASVVLKVEVSTNYNEIVEIMRKNPYFEMHSVVGDHHVHLNEPSKVSPIIAKFIDKYRPRANGTSKL